VTKQLICTVKSIRILPASWGEARGPPCPQVDPPLVEILRCVASLRIQGLKTVNR